MYSVLETIIEIDICCCGIANLTPACRHQSKSTALAYEINRSHIESAINPNKPIYVGGSQTNSHLARLNDNIALLSL